MQTKTLKDLSLDPNSKVTVVNNQQLGYDLDNFAKKETQTSEYDYNKDIKSTADALIDGSLLVGCNYLNFIEFKKGNMNTREIRHKAIESFSVYAQWKSIKQYNKLPKKRLFLLVYSNRSNQDFKRRARSIVNTLKNDIIVSHIYEGHIYFCSGSDFDNSLSSYLK